MGSPSVDGFGWRLILNADIGPYSTICLVFHDYISPHSVILTGMRGRLFCPVGTFSIFLSVKRPSVIFPKIVCLPSKTLGEHTRGDLVSILVH